MFQIADGDQCATARRLKLLSLLTLRMGRDRGVVEQQQVLFLQNRKGIQMHANKLKRFIKEIPLIGPWATKAYRAARFGTKSKPFSGSASYWESRYASGGNSGVGSYEKFAEFKAEVINKFVADHDVQSVIEFGCGDGNQLKLAAYHSYLGLDVSSTAIQKCRKEFAGDATKRFASVSEYHGEKMDLALSMDVIYHLVEDAIFAQYMRTLFESSNRYVVIYSSNQEAKQSPDAVHVRHRKFTTFIDLNLTEWKLMQHIPNRFPFQGDYTTGSFADFFIYERA